jgi:hypothetical protein
MSLHRLPGVRALVVFSTFISCSPEGEAFGPGEAAQRSNARQRADYKVLIWYRKTDSLATFKYEIYDLRKGEYTVKVDDWIKDVRVKYPAYYVALRDVELAREKGKTELLKVGSVINRELAVAASLAGIAIGPGQSDSRPMGYGVFSGAPAAGSNRVSGLGRMPSARGVDRQYLNQSITPYPIPVPLLNRPR